MDVSSAGGEPNGPQPLGLAAISQNSNFGNVILLKKKLYIRNKQTSKNKIKKEIAWSSWIGKHTINKYNIVWKQLYWLYQQAHQADIHR